MNVAPVRFTVMRLRRWGRGGDAALLVLAIAIGATAGLLTLAQSAIAHGLQSLLYGVSINRLSALASIRHPAKLLFLPLGGLLLVLFNRLFATRRTSVDVVEANALHGGRIPLRDSLTVCMQTLVSNGFGASVGLEAAYAQAGGGMASAIGQWLHLRRADMRILVGAGAGAAIGAAFSSPLTGAFYAFEIVIGAYAPAALAPVAAASLAAALIARSFGVAPFLTVVEIAHEQSTLSYLLYAALGIACSVCGIAIVRLQSLVESQVNRFGSNAQLRPIVGGLLLIPIAWLSPQALSSGHGALRLELALHPAIEFLALVFVLKVIASTVSLSFGFRGGLFFASLFLGSLLGPIFAQVVNLAAGAPVLSELDAALVGMAALSVTIVGGPMTLAMLVLETTHDFALTGVVLTATLCASAFTRARFGYSFSTWRLHMRGAKIRGPRDVGWTSTLTAARLMRRDPTVIDAAVTIGEFRSLVPLGATSRVLLRDANGRYCGIVETARAYDPSLLPSERIAELAVLAGKSVGAGTSIDALLDRFEELDSDDLAVVDDEGRIIGVLTEKYVTRRYIEESEKAQAQLFGE